MGLLHITPETFSPLSTLFRRGGRRRPQRFWFTGTRFNSKPNDLREIVRSCPLASRCLKSEWCPTCRNTRLKRSSPTLASTARVGPDIPGSIPCYFLVNDLQDRHCHRHCENRSHRPVQPLFRVIHPVAHNRREQQRLRRPGRVHHAFERRGNRPKAPRTPSATSSHHITTSKGFFRACTRP